jgi:hypothetical protein
MLRTILLIPCLLFNGSAGFCAAAPIWPGYVDSGFRHEQSREIHFAEDCRAIVLAPPVEEFDSMKSTLLVIYATPNGNTAEQTLGCKLSEGRDWHFDIQHVAAQWRAFRELESQRNVILACVQANNQSWPAWKSQRLAGPRYIRQIVESLAANMPSQDVHIMLTGHSGGGSFLFGYIDAGDEIPASIERIAFLDANYGYDTAQKHGEKILGWLDGDKSRYFVVLAYDDRNIELAGKKVVSPTGGTYRATNRMLEFLKQKVGIADDKQGGFKRYIAANGRLIALVHPNPDNVILHTRLVGEMNGLLESLTLGTTQHRQWGQLGAPRAYSEYVQPKPLESTKWHPAVPALPPRLINAKSGSQIVSTLRDAAPAERERALAYEILSGNVPDFWRQFIGVSAEATLDDGKTHTVTYRVTPDYLAIGSDDDFIRMPLTPYVAQQVADVLGCVLPTRKMVNDIYQNAEVKLTPQPLTEDRESLATFFEHHKLIQQAWQTRQPRQLVAGIKKDVVVTNKLLESPRRVAIYGWHKSNGEPIQPLTTVHADSYVDYSHGIRLIDAECQLDGQSSRVEDIWKDKQLWPLLSDEGPLECSRYRQEIEKP